MSDNCDHNFGTFDDFGGKNDQNVSNNMILMSKYKGKHGEKGQKIRTGVSPPPFRAMPERKLFFYVRASLSLGGSVRDIISPLMMMYRVQPD